MSGERKTAETRRYRKRRRAELEEETRRRITEAAMELHGSVGPVRTTFSAVAERAGVQRATVYRHFPDEEALFGACSAHWATLYPPPDPGRWTEIADVDERLRSGLDQLYAWYERKPVHEMLERTTRDAPLVPAMADAVAALRLWYDAAAEALVRGRPERGARRARVEAAIGHALEFATWRSLVSQQGLSRADAVALMAATVSAAAKL